MEFDLVIVGAGLVGASLAAALRATGLRIGLVDPQPAPAIPNDEWDGRVYAISPGSRRFLEACGAWTRIASDRIATVATMDIRGDAAGSQLVFGAYEMGLAELCAIVESRSIERALLQVIAEDAAICVRRPCSPVSLAFSDSGVSLTLSDASTMEARLLVAADGVQSWVRGEVGIETHGRDYHSRGVVANFAVQGEHHGIAYQWFRRDGVLALLPLPGNRVSMVWSTPDQAAERLLALDARALASEVEAAAGNVLGPMRLLNIPLAFPLHLTRVKELVRPRLALIGDAAHSVHPLAGQGVNLGFQDARELAAVLSGRGPQDDCGDWRLLRRYARARTEAITSMQAVTDGLQRLFDLAVPGARWLRNAGLSLTDRMAPLKKLLVQHALG